MATHGNPGAALAAGIAAAALAGLLSIAAAYLLGQAVNSTGAAAAGFLPNLLWFALCLLVQSLCLYVRARAFYSYGASRQESLRNAAARSLTAMHMRSIHKIRTGDMLTRMSKDIWEIEGFYRETLPETIAGVVSILAGTALLFSIRPSVAVLILVGSLACGAVSALIGIPLTAAGRAWKAAESEIGVRANDIAFGQLDIKAMGMEKS
ncbi:MAG: hypothetical protein LBU58_03095, partial [Clostridiales bacterium]|nr:hypothetical protein [Clostridiales bacterium]